MNATRTALKPLVDRFTRAVKQVHSLRFVMGDTVNSMLSIPGTSLNMIAKILREELPDAKQMLGYALSPKNLQAMATMASTFQENGGILHGKHRVSREDIERLALTPSEGETLATLATDGSLRVKAIAKAASVVKRDPQGVNGEKGKAAVANLRDILKAGSEKQAKKQSPIAIRDRLAAIEKSRAKLAEEEKELRAALASISEQEPKPEAKVDAPTVLASDASAPKAKAPRKRQAGTGKRSPQPQAS